VYKWLHANTKSPFVLLCQDDLFVNVPSLLRALDENAIAEQFGKEKVYGGTVIPTSKVSRDAGNPHYLPASIYAPERFPRYNPAVNVYILVC
jgi:hypothetical protein